MIYSSSLSHLIDGANNFGQKELFQLSQSHLNLLTTCPRKFQNFYLDQLGLPQPPEQQERQDLGARFHQLMQQRELGLPIASLIQAEPKLQSWFESFNQAPPEMLEGNRQSEYRLTLAFQGYLLIAVYDLLIQGDQQVQILDWKTYSRPQNPSWLQQNWQTRLYLYILAEASDYAPKQIRMTYWFAESKGKPSAEPRSLTFAYNSELHTQTHQELTQILENLTRYLAIYRQGGTFPQVEIEAGRCHGETSSCGFAIRCQRQRENEVDNNPVNDIEAIQEILL